MHDLDGSDVLSIMTAALRKLQGWSEKAWLGEMSRFLRQPPPEPEHLTFLRRLFSPTVPCPTSPPPAIPLSITVPPPSKRVDWLWKSGIPTAAALGLSTLTKKSGGGGGKEGQSHGTMRCRVEEDRSPPPPTAPSSVEGEGAEGEQQKLDAAAERERDRAEALGMGRQRSVTPNHSARVIVPSTPNRSRAPSPSLERGSDSAVNSGEEGSGPSDEVDELAEDGQSSAEVEEGEDDGEYDEEEDEDDGYEDEDEVLPLSQTIDALDLGL